ncbi:MAG TPA: hypothetical protein VIK18_03020 [Pirellulales bacterium]
MLAAWMCSGVLLLTAAAVPAAGPLDESLATLKKVGHHAAGNRAAVGAWSVVAAADAAQLPTLLAALDDAGPLAANYLRAAIDAVAERALAQGQKLPQAALERLILDTSHSPLARRLAYDWLAKVDPAAAERMIPRFLNDPSVELRRDAVARLTSEGLQLVGRGDAKGAAPQQPATAEPQLAQGIARLRRAFDAARDLDQIAQLDKELTGLKQKVDLPRHFGFVTTWRVVGPFDNRNGVGFDAVYPPEQSVDFAARYPGKAADVAWQAYTTSDREGKVDLNQVLGKDLGCAAYAAAEFYSPRRQDVDLRLASACANKLWLNGKLIDRHKIYHTGASIDQYQSHATLEPGRNLILLKICQNEQTQSWAQDWGFQFRVCDSVGTAILSSGVQPTARHEPSESRDETK